MCEFVENDCYREGRISICASLTTRPDTDLTMFSKQSQHTDFFMLFFVYFFFLSFDGFFFSLLSISLILLYSFCFALLHFPGCIVKRDLMNRLHSYHWKYSFFGLCAMRYRDRMCIYIYNGQLLMCAFSRNPKP